MKDCPYNTMGKRCLFPCNTESKGSFFPSDTDHNRCLYPRTIAVKDTRVHITLKAKDAYANGGNKEYICPCCTECKDADV